MEEIFYGRMSFDLTCITTHFQKTLKLILVWLFKNVLFLAFLVYCKCDLSLSCQLLDFFLTEFHIYLLSVLEPLEYLILILVSFGLHDVRQFSLVV